MEGGGVKLTAYLYVIIIVIGETAFFGPDFPASITGTPLCNKVVPMLN
jgi:hypothetical protein